MQNNQNNQNEHRGLIPLADLDDCQLENSDQDVRQQPLLMPDGRSVGTIKEMLINPDRERVGALVLSDGRTVPIDEVELRDGRAYMMPERGAGNRTANKGSDLHIPIIQERLVVGKREVEGGGVHVKTHMEERPVEESVMLREEHVDVERRPVRDGRVTSSQADKLMKDQDFEVTATSEEPVIGKDARVTEEVVVSKDVNRRRESVTGTERHTEVDIDKTGDRNSKRR